jgi:hypothetical protein
MKFKTLSHLLLFILIPYYSYAGPIEIDSKDLANTLERIYAQHSVTLEAPFLDSDLDSAYSIFGVQDFIKQEHIYKKVINLLIAANRFNGRDLIYLSKMTLSNDEKQKYLSLVSPDSEFWYPYVAPATGGVVLELFKFNQGLSDNKKILEIIKHSKGEALMFMLFNPEIIDDVEILQALLLSLDNHADAVIIAHDCSGSGSTTWANFSEIAFNFFAKKYPGKYEPLDMFDASHEEHHDGVHEHHPVKRLDISPAKIAEYKAYFQSRIEGKPLPQEKEGKPKKTQNGHRGFRQH